MEISLATLDAILTDLAAQIILQQDDPQAAISRVELYCDQILEAAGGSDGLVEPAAMAGIFAAASSTIKAIVESATR